MVRSERFRVKSLGAQDLGFGVRLTGLGGLFAWGRCRYRIGPRQRDSNPCVRPWMGLGFTRVEPHVAFF